MDAFVSNVRRHKETNTMTDRTSKAIEAQLARLGSMRRWELAAKFEELHGFAAADTTPAKLRARLAFRIQEIFLGGISADDKAVLERVAASDPLSNFQVPKGRGHVPTLPGTQLRRVWKGVEHVVDIVGEDEFEYNGERYTSLSRLARAITGSKWNGKLFFGVR